MQHITNVTVSININTLYNNNFDNLLPISSIRVLNFQINIKTFVDDNIQNINFNCGAE